jgi:nucleotide-binding universal stress UspA family protein
MGGSLVYKNILFCTDFSDDAHMAFVHALDLTRKYRAKLYLLHIIPPLNPCGVPPDTSHTDKPVSPSENIHQIQQQVLKAMIKQYVHELDEQDDYDIQVCTGSPDIEIIRFARRFHIDMIILGAQGRPEKDRRIFIRTAANVSKFAPCQVIAIRSPKDQVPDTATTL